MNALPFPLVLDLAAKRDGDALFDLLASQLAETIDFDFLTVLVPEPSGRFLTRIYSTNPEAYPLGPADEVDGSEWFQRLFAAGAPIIAVNDDEIEKWLPGFDGFRDTPYDALVNYPVIAGGQTIGIINLTGRAGRLPADCDRLIEPHVALAASGISTHLANR